MDDEDCSFAWSLGDSLDEQDAPQPVNVDLELEQFRNQWEKELASRHDKTNKQVDDNYKKNMEPSIEEQARYLFIQGVNAEHSGRLYDAIKYYRRAVQLVPDIEFRIKDYIPRIRRRSQRTDSESSFGTCSESEEVEDLMQHFSELQAHDETSICQKEISRHGGHISDMPWEILMYIFKWVISKDLDIPSLENLSEVCRGFYVVARDEELWKLISQRVFSGIVGRPGMYGSYRNMYIQKPHVRTNGCYISRLEYFRRGEEGLDGFYRPIHVVEYYRYVRFFPNGEMLMLTTPDNPYMALSKLKHPGSKTQGILHGYYKLSSDRVTAVLKRRRVAETNQYQYRYKYRRQIQNNNNDTEQNFHVEYSLTPIGRRSHCQLTWNHYAVHSYYRLTGQEQITDFDLSSKNYPALIFSRVKSYTTTADAPLI